jgi:hypothetical protein
MEGSQMSWVRNGFVMSQLPSKSVNNMARSEPPSVLPGDTGDADEIIRKLGTAMAGRDWLKKN